MQQTNTNKQNTQPLPITTQTKPHRTAYELNRVRLQITFPPEGRTKQAFRDECDINKIMARYQQTGILPETQQKVAIYLDAENFDFQRAQDQIALAKNMFEAVPANIREQFDNDPAKFVQFCENPENHSKLVEMGLATPRAPSSGGGSTPPLANAPTAQPINPEAAKSASLPPAISGG
ncbi:MAG: internal scaffolding protein [Microvirus sp.]|nr:MAG: internal scaffolding protein [Microvirus sp.]